MQNRIIFLMSLFILSIYSISFALESPPELKGDLNAKQASDLTVYLFQTAKFKIGDKPIIEKLEAEISERIAKDNSDPALWFFKGRLTAILHALHVQEMQKENFSRDQILGSPEYTSLKEASVSAYKRALELDSQVTDSVNLNLQMLGSISMYVFSDADMRVEANRKKIERIKEHPEERTTDIESWEFKVYGNIVTAYVDEKRYDEALSVLEEMKEKFPYAQSLKEIDEAIGRIEARKAEALSAEKEAEKNQVAAPEPALAKEPEKPQPQNIVPEPTQTPQQPKQVAEQKPQPPDTTKSPTASSRLIIVIAALAVLIIAVFVLVRRKSK